MTRNLKIATALAILMTSLPTEGAPPDETGPYCEQGLSGFATPGMLTRDWSHPVTFETTVEEVTLMLRPGELIPSVRLLVAMEDGRVDVHLGPQWFLSANWMVLEPGDTVEITGRVVEVEGEECFVAIIITSGEETLLLRTAEGKPLWEEVPATRSVDPI